MGRMLPEVALALPGAAVEVFLRRFDLGPDPIDEAGGPGFDETREIRVVFCVGLHCRHCGMFKGRTQPAGGI